MSIEHPSYIPSANADNALIERRRHFERDARRAEFTKVALESISKQEIKDGDMVEVHYLRNARAETNPCAVQFL